MASVNPCSFNSSAVTRRSSSTTWRCDGWYGASTADGLAIRSRISVAGRHGASPLYSTMGSTGGSAPGLWLPVRSSSTYSSAVYSSTRSAMAESVADWYSSITSTWSQPPAWSALRARSRHAVSPRRCWKALPTYSAGSFLERAVVGAEVFVGEEAAQEVRHHAREGVEALADRIAGRQCVAHGCVR